MADTSGVRSSGPDSAGREEKPSGEPQQLPRPPAVPRHMDIPFMDIPEGHSRPTCPICAALAPACLARSPSPCSEFPSSLCDAGTAMAFAFPWICRLLLPPTNPRRLRNCAPGSPLRIRSPLGLADQETIAQAGQAEGSVSSWGVPSSATPSAMPKAASSLTSSATLRQDQALGANHHRNLLPAATLPADLHPDPAPSLHSLKPRSSLSRSLTRTALSFPSAVLADDRGVGALHCQPGHSGALHVRQG